MRAAELRSRRRPHHASFLQPRQPAFWLYLLIVGLSSVVAVGEQSFFRDVSPGGWALSWVLLTLYGLPVAGVVYLLDLYEREPTPLLVAAFVWGAVAATTLSAIGNAGWGLTVARLGDPEFAARWTAALTAPFVEETLKGCGIVLIYLIARDEVDDVMDGFVYGAICGLGFAIVEDVVYFMAVFGGQPSGVLQGFWVRVVASGLYGHVLYTGLVGMAVGIVVSRRTTEALRRRLGVAAALCALAAFAHFLWNSPVLTLFPAEPWSGTDYLSVVAATAVKGLPLFAFVALAVTLARRRERRWLHRVLDGEIGLDGISAYELRLLESPRRRRAARSEMRRRAGTRASALLHRLQREQVNLAMIASRVADARDPALARQRAYCASLREALRAIPGAAPAAGEGSAGAVPVESEPPGAAAPAGEPGEGAG
jgi:protease PrsW